MKGSKMKKMKKRILAALLCTTMMLNTGMSAMADGGTAVSSESAHVHTEECYEKSKTDNLICTKEEAAEGHVHGDTCYEVTSTPELICTQAETEGHTHGDSCMETTKNLICGKEEHTHGGDCYKTETRDVCSDESEEHTCGDGCVETEEVLTCTAEEHTHDDGCYEVKTNIVCGQNEVEAHTHGEGCYTTAENKVLKCTLEEVEAHTHNDDCYAWEEKLVCTLPETAPAAEQPEKEEKAEEAEEAAEVNLQNDDETGIKVSVKSTSDVIPEDTKVVVAPMEMDEEHETALAEAVSEFEVLGYTAYDISLKDAEDEDITLGENKVEVAIDFEELIPEGINAEEVKDVVLVHITTDEEDKLTAETVGTVEITEEKATVEFEADSFSPYVVTYLSEAEETVEEVVVEEPVVEDITLTYTSEDEAYTVTVTAAPEVLENVTAFEAVPVTDEEKITALTEQLTAKAAEAQKTSLGFENYEIKFLDAEGNEVSVNGEVKVSLSFAEEKIPEAATAENVDAVDAALLKTGTNDKGEAVLEEINGLVSAEAGAVKEVVYTTEAPEELILAWNGDVYRNLEDYEDAEVVIKLSGTEYALQNVVGFNVTPIKEDNEETKEQYAEVAQQLDEKIAEENEAKEEEKAVVGFLAYDITLVDAEGNALEPQGGVRVSMEYKEAAAPEAVAEAEEAEVTIHHFEEDEKGEVKQIVDMVAEETIEAEVTTTENAEVEKAEFVTDSFSTYTITWTAGRGNNNNRSISGTIVTTEGVYPKVENKTISLGNTQKNDVDIADVEFEDIKIDNQNYYFKEAVVCRGNYDATNGINVTTINYDDSWKLYKANDEYQITNNSNGYILYFVYERVVPITTTVDSRANNINIHVSDYSMWGNSNTNQTWPHNVIYNINSKSSLNFVRTGTNTAENDCAYNTFTGGSGLYQGIVKRNLQSDSYNPEEKYPVLDKDSKGRDSGKSLDYLFKNGYDANKLFQMKDGYYVYDSSKNFAQLDTSGNGNLKEFIVYNASKRGFFPFNAYIDNVQTGATSEHALTNHHFGMNVDFTFLQPKDGKVNSEDMVFSFSGDDDVWVFIDDMLVLDLGGIHQPSGGTINFANGVVEYTNAANTTIREMYIEAYTEKFGKAQATAKADEHFISYTDEETGKTYYRFKDYSGHTLNFFYLERGAGDTNCKIEFNLISIPKDSVKIEKEIVNYTDGAYSDVEFSFKMYLQKGKKDSQVEDGEEDAPDELVKSTEENPIHYEYKTADGETETITLGNDGVFKLKHKESATFTHMYANTEFYVVETDINSQTYDNVEIKGSDVLNEDDQVIGSGEESISTRTLVVGRDYYAKFRNTCAATNMKHIVIEKELNGYSADSHYLVQVTVAGEQYKGKYKVGSDYTEALNSKTEWEVSEVGEYKNVISIPANQVAVVLGYVTKTDATGKVVYGIPSGTSFKVQEVGLSQSKYDAPVYSVYSYNQDYSPNIEAYKEDAHAYNKGYRGYVEGTLILDANPVVHIKNTPATINLDLKKTTVDGSEVAGAEFELERYENSSWKKIEWPKTTNSNDEVTEKTTRIVVDNANGKVELTGLSEGTYRLKETKAPKECSLLESYIYFKVEDRNVTLIEDEQGNVLDTLPDMWGLDNNVLTIKNTVIYTLPSTGGHGIYTTMLSGFALMLGAAYVWFKSRREESSNN